MPEDRPNLLSCQMLVKDLGLDERVTFLGKRGDIPSLLAAVDVVVMSTHYEGMSLSVIEGMASGKPFIASDVSGVRNQVNGAGLLFPESDAEALAHLIMALRNDPAYAAEVAARCQARVAGYSIDSMVVSYLDLYSRLCEKHGK